MRVLVTGAAGMIGSHIAEALLARGDQVVALDNLSRGDERNIPDGANFARVDVTDSRALASTFDRLGPFDAVLHEASIINEGIDAEDVAVDVAVNIEGTLNLLRCAKAAGVRRFVYASSVAVYGRPSLLPATESATLPEPIASYGIGKLSAEHYVRYFANASSGMTYACLRYSNIYGPRQKPFGEVGVIGIFVERIAEHAPLVQHGDGSQCRDFLYIADCVSATLAALDSAASLTLNVGSGRPTSVSELISALRDVAGDSVTVTHAPMRRGELGRFWCNIDLARTALSWAPSTSLSEGLRKTLDWRLGATVRP